MYALLQTAAFRPIVSFPCGLLLLKSCIDAIILLGMGMLLAVIIPSSNYVRLDVFQRFINYFALGFLYVSIWVLFGYLSSILLLGNENGMRLFTYSVVRFYRPVYVCDTCANDPFQDDTKGN
jgi:hypothetical protein